LLSNSRSYDPPLTPPRETRYTPDETKIVSRVEGQTDLVTPEEVKEFITITHDQFNLTIDKLIESVTSQVESYVRRDLIQKNIQSYWRRTPKVAILSRGPHVSITSASVEDENGNSTTLTEGTDFKVEGISFKRLYNFQQYGKLTVDYVSGYTEDERPAEVGSAILQEISLQFKNRQDPDTPAMTSVGNLSLEARHLLNGLIRRAL
jgi:hypothetical protein